MDAEDERIRYAIQHTEVLRFPTQSLATFGTTNIKYYLLTNPVYAEPADRQETVIREGKVSAERPRIITPAYLTRLEGFGGNARKYLDLVMREYGPHAPGLLYSYKNEPEEFTIVSDAIEVVAGRLKETIDKEDRRLAAIIQGVDELWDVSLLKFIRELTEGSLRSNIAELGSRGLLDIDHAGVPRDARYRIERLFEQVASGDTDPSELKRELDRWDLFAEYEDRFLALFHRRRWQR